MEIILCIYFGINIFLSGYWFNENNKWESTRYTILVSLICILFGVLWYLIYFLFLISSPILGYIYKEITFQYKFYFTDFWDKIMLDDNYSDEYKTTKEKLARSEKLVKTASKQLQRHNRLIQKRYANK